MAVVERPPSAPPESETVPRGLMPAPDIALPAPAPAPAAAPAPTAPPLVPAASPDPASSSAPVAVPAQTTERAGAHRRLRPAPARPARSQPLSRRRRADLVALLVLAFVPFAVSLSLDAAGRVMLLGDDFDQNYPLRVLVGELIRNGQMPAWDPFIWSGTPLLQGWNAGAMFPATWLFAVLGPTTAWAVGLGLTYALSGVGTYLLARRLSCRPVAAFVGAVAFSYTGFMNGQIVHIGLVEGTALLPILLLGIDGLAGGPWSDRVGSSRHSVAWTTLVAVTAALIVLAGDPRAVTTAGIAAALYVLGCIWVAPRSARRVLGLTALAAAGAAALSAVQWLPGFGFLQASQRGAGAFSQFGDGSIPLGQLGQLLTLPFALGGNDRVGLARYEGPQNLAELSVGVGLLALVALFVYLPELLAPLVRRLRPARRRPPRAGRHSAGRAERAAQRRAARTAGLAAGGEDWAAGRAPVVDYWAEFDRVEGSRARRRLGVWYALAVAGALAAAGTTTPLGHLMAHVPLYDGERLPGRNVAMLDLALCALLAFLVDDVVTRRPGPLRRWWGKALALVPLAGAAGLALAARVDPGPVLGYFGFVGAPPKDDFLPRQDVYFAVMITVALVVAFAVLLAERRLGRRLLGLAIVLDLGVVAVSAGFFTVPASTVAATTPDSTAVARLAGTGRYALFNPYIHSIVAEPDYITDSGLTDLNIVHGLPSVQGYGSVVAREYNAATGTHGLEVLDTDALSDGTFDLLDLRVLLTLPLYLDEPIPVHAAIPVAGGPPARADASPGVGVDAPNASPLASGPWSIAPGGTAYWWLPEVRNVIRVIAVLHSRSGPPPAKIEVGLGLGAAESPAPSLQSVDVVNGQAIYFLPGRTPGELVELRNPGTSTVVVGAVLAVSSHPDQRLLLDGALQGELTPGNWSYAGKIGPLPVFVNEQASGLAWLQPLFSVAPELAPRAPGSVVVDPGNATSSEQEIVHLAAPARLVRSEAYEPGWQATVTPLSATPAAAEAAKSEPVQQFGIIQAIDLPAGAWRVSWRYAPASLAEGADTSLAALSVLVLLGLAGAVTALGRSRHAARGARHRRRAIA